MNLVENHLYRLLEAWSISNNSLVLRGLAHSSLCSRDLQLVPAMNAPTMSTSLMLGSSVHYLEKFLMYSRRYSSGFYLQL